MSAAPAQKYRFIAELGHGGMADVYLAVLQGMEDFKKLAVVKQLRSHLAEDPDFLAMFLQEARIAARLNHPNVVTTFEVGRERDRYFMAMEYLEGHPYSALLARAGREKLDFAIQVKILIDVLEGLNYAHELADFDGRPLALVHRDVSPQNVFITYDGQVKLLDFGIAKALDSAVETRTGIIKGNLSYMSPEQALANPVDRRSDLYSVGVLLWEAVAQRRRWRGLSKIQLMKEIASHREVVLPELKGRNLPSLVPVILARVLAYDPDERYATAPELQADLEKLQEELGRRVTKRELGTLVSELFAGDRTRLGETIEAALKSDGPREPDEKAPLVQLDPPGSFTPTKRSPTVPASSVSLPSIRPPRQRRRWLPVVGAVLAVGAVAAGAWVARFGHAWLTASTTSPPDSSTVMQSAAAPQNTTVRVRVSAQPSSATLFLDDKEVSNPYHATLPTTRGTVRIRAENPGYVTETRPLDLSHDVNMRIELVPDPAAASASAEPKNPRSHHRHVRIRHHSAKAPPPVAPSPSPAAPTATQPVMKPPARKQTGGVTLDTANPWSK